MFPKIKAWIPLAIVITALSLLVYGALQQDLRLSSNDPQIRIAEDLRQDLNSGKKLEEALLSKNVDISKSLSEFAIVFDDNNNPTLSQASLDGKIPTPPKGVFDFVRTHEQDRFTWEPKPGVRVAAVVIKYNQGFVLAGRSIREVEKREDWIFKITGITWLGTLILTLIFYILFKIPV